MKSSAVPAQLLRFGIAALLVSSAGIFFAPRAVHAQTLTMDFTINSDINSPTASANIAINSTYTVDVWVVALPGANSPPSAPVSDLGFVSAYFGARSSGTGAIAGTGNGISAYSFAPGFSGNGPIAPADANGDGINDISSLSNKNTTQNAITSSASNDFANTSGDGGEADGAGWAWEVGTLTVKTGATIGAGGTSTIFTPSIPTFTGARVDWTFNGGTSQVSNTTTPTAYPLSAGSAVTFNVVSSNTSVLNLSPTALTFNLLENAASPAAQNLSLQETSGTSGNTATYTGTSPTGFSVNNGSSGTVNAGATNTLATSYTGGTGTPGTTTATYTVTNKSTGDVTAQGNLSATLTAVVGDAVTDGSATGSFTGTVLSGTVANGGSYDGLASLSDSGVRIHNPNNSLPGFEGSVATILAGMNNQGGPVNVSMTWRSRMLVETSTIDSVNGAGWPNGTPMSPPLPKGPLPLISDVVNLYGMSAASTGLNPANTAPAATDPFALEMTFNPATLNAEGASGNAMASRGNLYLASLVPVEGTPTWMNTIIPDVPVAGGGMGTYLSQTIQIGSKAAAAQSAGNPADPLGTFNLPVLSSYAAFAAANGITDANIGNYVGDWGVDTSSADEAWAIVDHNSEFAVVPEPSTLVLAAFGLFGCAVALRRKNKV